MPDPAPAPPAAESARPPSEPIARSVHCLTCGYDLRGLQPTGTCPECNRDIAETLRGDWLRWADLVWLITIDRAREWLSTGAKLVGVGTACWLVAACLMLWLNLPTVISTVLGAMFGLAMAVIASGMLVSWVGQLMLAQREPASDRYSVWFDHAYLMLTIGVLPGVTTMVMLIGQSRFAPFGSTVHLVALAASLLLWAQMAMLMIRARSIQYRCREFRLKYPDAPKRPRLLSLCWPGVVIAVDFVAGPGWIVFLLIGWVVFIAASGRWLEAVADERNAAENA